MPKARIVVVEDEPAIRRGVSDALRLSGYEVTEAADGPAIIETYTVRRDSGKLTGIVIGRLVADDSRFLASTEDADLIAKLTEGEPLGQRIRVRSFDYGNRCTLG